MSSLKEKIGNLAEQKKLVLSIFPALEEHMGRKGGVLSGVQQQLAIGRALMANPKMLLLDEPTEGIQPNIVAEIAHILNRIRTEWGPISISICYDYYCFPEMMRYGAAKGARMHINSTALAECHGPFAGTAALEAQVIMNQMYIVSSNLGGKDLYNVFWGGSSIMGPSREFWEVYYYAGHKFNEKIARESEMFTATIDLSLAALDEFKFNPAVNGTDFRPDKYIEMYRDVLNDPNFGKEKQFNPTA